MPSRLSSLLEDQADALLSTFWWHADQKYGRTTRLEASIPRTTLGRIYRQARLIWENLLLRMALFYTLPYVLSVSVELERPGRLGGQLALLSFLAPWFYHIFIYTWFLDPLRHLPGPKVIISYSTTNSRAIGYSVSASESQTKTYPLPIICD